MWSHCLPILYMPRRRKLPVMWVAFAGQGDATMACGKRPWGPWFSLQEKHPWNVCEGGLELFFFEVFPVHLYLVLLLSRTGTWSQSICILPGSQKKEACFTPRWQVTLRTTLTRGKVSLCSQNSVLGMSGLLSKTNTIWCVLAKKVTRKKGR